MFTSLKKWRKLSALERRQLAVLGVFLPIIDASLRLFGYKKTLGFVEFVSRHSTPRAPTADDISSANRLAELANVAGRRGALQATCLRQALTVHGWLRLRGLASQLKLGVGRLSDVPDMHAWVELDGHALGEVHPRHVAFQ